ncbi:MAG TPA: polysaccharide deacetylase family protein [Candidatus Hydrogenedentes bacterium]|nr:polysaccharide deacetylase family protein [Candidatus Hydrogenedentota bacterium]HPG70154.1 polysaccharide deacetylase family protein [Candidatus Hydrogenedentota bacterium]
MGSTKTYAERLGWGPKDRVVIFHVDDVGMSHSSNRGAIQAMEQGVATSCSIMTPCSWTSEYVHYLKQHPDADAGMHVTLTSEWSEYRWGPVAGKSRVPGLVDPEGCLWPDVPEVVEHATVDEVELEMRAQLDRLLTMGITPTHLDTHMGTVFGTIDFAQRYIMIGIEHHIPVFLPGGHNQYMIETNAIPPGFDPDLVRMVGEGAWEAGLPVLDDAHITGYDAELDHKLEIYGDVMHRMAPGVIQVIVHATDPTDEFQMITDSGPTRLGDLKVMMDPRFRKVLEDEGIILTTWRELKERRDAAE